MKPRQLTDEFLADRPGCAGDEHTPVCQKGGEGIHGNRDGRPPQQIVEVHVPNILEPRAGREELVHSREDTNVRHTRSPGGLHDPAQLGGGG